MLTEIIFLVVTLIVGAVGIVSQERSHGSWLLTSDRQRMVFRTPPAFRVFPNTMAVFLACTSYIVFSVILHGAAAHASAGATQYTSLALYSCMLCGGLLTLLWLGGSQELEIDLASRSYRGTRRWLWFTQTRRGSLDDTTGVDVRNRSVFLTVKSQAAGSYILGIYNSHLLAAAQAERVASDLGLDFGSSSSWEA